MQNCTGMYSRCLLPRFRLAAWAHWHMQEMFEQSWTKGNFQKGCLTLYQFLSIKCLYCKKLVIFEQNWGRDSCFLALGAFGNSCLRKVHSVAELPVEASVFPPIWKFSSPYWQHCIWPAMQSHRFELVSRARNLRLTVGSTAMRKTART